MSALSTWRFLVARVVVRFAPNHISINVIQREIFNFWYFLESPNKPNDKGKRNEKLSQKMTYSFVPFYLRSIGPLEIMMLKAFFCVMFIPACQFISRTW